MNKALVVKSNRIIEASYRITLNEQRLILCCISQIDSRPECEHQRITTSDTSFEVSALDFSNLTGVAKHTAYEALQDASSRLFERAVTIDNPLPNNPNAKLKTRWVSSVLYMPDTGRVSIKFASDMIPYLVQLHGNFTSYRLADIGLLESGYAVRLFEMLMQYKTQGWFRIELSAFKNALQLEQSYERLDNLKRKVVDIAVGQINTHTNYHVSYDQRKAGRVVTHLVFNFEPKPLKPSKPATKTKQLKPSKKEIEQLARVGESYAEAEDRIIRERMAS